MCVLGGKPNVIVVQKTQPRRLSGTPTSSAKGTTVISSPFEKVCVSCCVCKNIQELTNIQKDM